MGARTRTGLVAVVAALAITGSVPTLPAASAATQASPPLVEAAACAAPTPLPAVERTRTNGDTVVSFQVPAVARLRVRGGDVVAGATNTRCAPRPGDRFVVGDRPATPAEVAAALRTAWSGDWTTPGAWHPAG